ncbi:MAG: cell division protein FtsQ/DivIB [Burkholderiales bacterium]|jgi:cell division protein FtsQ|nr:cell division protein FtsQ/DivIB [Burkholderiales bacterium]
MASKPKVTRRRREPEGTGPWHNARLLNGIANGLFALAALIAVSLAWQAAIRSDAFPLREIVVTGDLANLDPEDLDEAFAAAIPGNFFGADLADVRQRLAAVPWVRNVEIRREWPDRLEAKIEEHVALARWGDKDLVNTHGEVFSAPSEERLPYLAGPPGTSHEVASRYAGFRERLAPVGLELTHVTLSGRYAWQLKMDTPTSRGLTVELGREQSKDPIDARLARFVDAWPRTLARLDRRLDYVDLRYPNGFALRAPDLVDRIERPAPARRAST